MIHYPQIDPVLLKITDSFQIHWYGIMYIIGFVLAWLFLRYRTKNLPNWQSVDTINDLFFYAALGVLLGGRIGYMIFYDFIGWIDAPLSIFSIQNGGMSFHGGLLGVGLAIAYFARQYHFRFLSITDLVVPVVPLGLMTGRMGNFINGELWGRTTDVPWSMIFPHAGELPRHPAQLYAVGLEGILLFIILWTYSSKPRQTGAVSGLFLIGYALIRIFEEFFRQPDAQYGYLAFGWLTMGQILCLPMLALGLWFFMGERRCANT